MDPLPREKAMTTFTRRTMLAGTAAAAAAVASPRSIVALPDHPAKRIHELLPWNWRPPTHIADAA